MGINGKMVGIEEIAQALKVAENVVICGHVSPDGDCLGSELALAAALRKLGKKVTCLLARDEKIEPGLRFLPGCNDFVPACDFDGECHTFVSVDVPHADRMGLDAKRLHMLAKDTISIDHHISEEPMSRINHVDPKAPAVAMLIWQIIPYLGVERDADMATCCYVGLMTDCGRFAYQNSTAEAFLMASQMISAGADPAAIATQVYQNRSRASLSLEKRMLDHVEYLNGGACAMSYLRRSDFVETNAVKADAEPLINIIRSVRGVRVACMLREQDGQVRGSLRAKDDTDVSFIAQRFGGGGHKAAAGFTYRGSLSDARKTVGKILNELF